MVSKAQARKLDHILRKIWVVVGLEGCWVVCYQNSGRDEQERLGILQIYTITYIKYDSIQLTSSKERSPSTTSLRSSNSTNARAASVSHGKNLTTNHIKEAYRVVKKKKKNYRVIRKERAF